MKEFFAMGGYAFFVWGSYGVAAVVLTYNLIQPLLHRRAVLKRLREYFRLKNSSQSKGQ